MHSSIEKLRKLIGLLVREAEVLTLGQKIQNEARGEIEKVQRDYFLREQMKAIQKELGERDEQTVEAEEFRKKIEEAGMPEEADKQAKREMERLSRLPSAAAEYGVTAVEIAAAGKRMRRSSDAARRSGEVRAVSGIDSLRE